MAMLAEPRRRQKYSSDPRGLAWSKDESKFGQRMLEKMGWSKGKGLGANEDGSLEHIKVQHKMDARGVGCSNKHADNWIAHQDDFNDLLANLHSSHSTDGTPSKVETTAVQSLEQKSRESKGRVHYHKFTKGKDLSRYNAVDMDCIFGKRKSKSQVNSEANSGTNSEAEGSQSASENDDAKFGVTTVTSTSSVQEYFAKKMAELKKMREKGNQSDQGKIDVTDSLLNEDSDSSALVTMEETKKKKKKKKNKRKYVDESESLLGDDQICDSLPKEDKDVEVKQGAQCEDYDSEHKLRLPKKKKKKENVECRAEEPPKKKKDKKKKEKTRDCCESVDLENGIETESTQLCVPTDSEVPKKKLSKKNKKDGPDAKVESAKDKNGVPESESCMQPDEQKNDSNNSLSDLFTGSNFGTLKGYGADHNVGFTFNNRKTKKKKTKK